MHRGQPRGFISTPTHLWVLCQREVSERAVVFQGGHQGGKAFNFGAAVFRGVQEQLAHVWAMLHAQMHMHQLPICGAYNTQLARCLPQYAKSACSQQGCAAHAQTHAQQCMYVEYEACSFAAFLHNVQQQLAHIWDMLHTEMHMMENTCSDKMLLIIMHP
eukprot:1160552-Pelagomonas_calceolata.AAC.16